MEEQSFLFWAFLIFAGFTAIIGSYIVIWGFVLNAPDIPAGTNTVYTTNRSNVDSYMNTTAVWINGTFETRYSTPADIPDCEYLTGGYRGAAQQGLKEGTMLGYMICKDNTPYHYEMILHNPITHETYWVKREGGEV